MRFSSFSDECIASLWLSVGRVVKYLTCNVVFSKTDATYCNFIIVYLLAWAWAKNLFNSQSSWILLALSNHKQSWPIVKEAWTPWLCARLIIWYLIFSPDKVRDALSKLEMSEVGWRFELYHGLTAPGLTEVMTWLRKSLLSVFDSACLIKKVGIYSHNVTWKIWKLAFVPAVQI